MATTMHRLQISVPEWQARFLTEEARQQGISIAELIRRMVQREARAVEASTDSLWSIAGIAKDPGPLIDGCPVSEAPEHYVMAVQGSTEK